MSVIEIYVWMFVYYILYMDIFICFFIYMLIQNIDFFCVLGLTIS